MLSEPKESEVDHEQFVLNFQDYTIVIYLFYFIFGVAALFIFMMQDSLQQLKTTQ